MMDMQLVEKGRRVPRNGLLDQGRVHLELEAKYRGALRAAGWTEALTRELADAVKNLEDMHAEAVHAHAEGRSDRRREQAAIDDAKACKRMLVVAFRDLCEDGLVSRDDYNYVRNSGDLHRSPALVSAYLADVRKVVAEHDALLRPFFDGRSALERLDEVKAELDAARSEVEASLTELPQETLKVYEAQGRLLVLIEKLNRRAKIAFDGQAHIAGLFNKDLILRARRARRATSMVAPIEMVRAEGEEATG